VDNVGTNVDMGRSRAGWGQRRSATHRKSENAKAKRNGVGEERRGAGAGCRSGRYEGAHATITECDTLTPGTENDKGRKSDWNGDECSVRAPWPRPDRQRGGVEHDPVTDRTNPASSSTATRPFKSSTKCNLGLPLPRGHNLHTVQFKSVAPANILSLFPFISSHMPTHNSVIHHPPPSPSPP
jgi:hypothetical protein